MRVYILTTVGSKVDMGNMDVYTDQNEAVKNCTTLNHLPSRTKQMCVWEADMSIHLERVISS